MIENTDIEYGEFEDALGWIVEAPFRAGLPENDANAIITAARRFLDVDEMGLWDFRAAGFTNVLVGNCGLDAAVVEELLEFRRDELLILLGIAAGRGKCSGP